MPFARLFRPGLLALAFSGLLLTACAGMPDSRQRSPDFVPPPGITVTVHRRLPVPPGRTRVFLQYGKVMRQRDLEYYDVSCDFEINTLANTTRYIEPGTFRVTRVRRDEIEIVRRAPLRYAALGTPAGLQLADGSVQLFEEVSLWLQSNAQPDVRRLTCRGGLADPWEMELPTVAEVREALGDYATVEMKQE